MMNYLTHQSRMPAYIEYPRFLQTLPLSDTARLVYITLLDRARLSLRNDCWFDADGHVYLVYPAEKLAEDLHRGVTTIKTALRALEKEGLITRRRQGVGRASHIYVKVPDKAADGKKKAAAAEQGNYALKDYDCEEDFI